MRALNCIVSMFWGLMLWLRDTHLPFTCRMINHWDHVLHGWKFGQMLCQMAKMFSKVFRLIVPTIQACQCIIDLYWVTKCFHFHTCKANKVSCLCMISMESPQTTILFPLHNINTFNHKVAKNNNDKHCRNPYKDYSILLDERH